MRRFHPGRLRDALLRVALQPRNLAKSLSRWTTAIVPSVTVISLDNQWLKLLQVQGPVSARRITQVMACGVEGASPEQIQRTFQETCAAEGLVARDILAANPTYLCTVRLFSLPSTDLKEIRDIVELQAEKHTPYAKEEILTDFKVIERGRAGYSRVLLVIAHQDVIRRLVQLLDAAQLPLDRVACELEGLINWFRLVGKAGRGSDASGASLVVDIDGSTSTLLLMHRGQPQFHRSLATGAEHLAEDPAQAGSRLVSELQRSVEASETEEGGAKIREVVLTGRTERLDELKGLIERGLNVPVTLAPPWAGCELSPRAREVSERLPDVSYASLVGLALAPSEIDLTPPAAKLRQAFEERAKALVVLGCQFIGVTILVSLLMMGRAQKQQRYYEQLRRLDQEHSQEAARVEEALRQIAFVKTQLRRRGQLLEAVKTLAVASPPTITWQSLTFTSGEGASLKGTSAALPTIYEFVAAITDTPFFGQVETKRVAKRKVGEQDVTDFEIHCPLVTAQVLP